MRQLLPAYIAKGYLQAISVVVVLGMLSLRFPPLSVLSSGAIALVALRKGPKEAGSVLLGSAVAMGILAQVTIGAFQVAAVYALLLWFPVLLLATALRASRNLALVIEAAVILGGLAVVAVYTFMANPAESWFAHMDTTLAPLLKTGPLVVKAESVMENVELISRYMTGIVVSGSVATLVLSLFLGRWWQSILYYPGGFREEYLELRMRKGIGYLCLLVVAVAFFATSVVEELAWNLSALFAVLYLIVGTAIMHTVLSKTKASRFWLAGFYLVLLFIPQIAIPVVLFGFTDSWLDWRGKLVRRSAN